MGMASTQFVRGKATLPDLSCEPTTQLTQYHEARGS